MSTTIQSGLKGPGRSNDVNLFFNNNWIRLNEEMEYNPYNYVLRTSSRHLQLTVSERKVMDYLIARKGQVVSREELMLLLWNTSEYISEGTLTTCISRLRRKIREISSWQLIETHKGIGYSIP